MPVPRGGLPGGVLITLDVPYKLLHQGGCILQRKAKGYNRHREMIYMCEGRYQEKVLPEENCADFTVGVVFHRIRII